MDIDECEFAQVKEESDVISEEIIDNSIKPEIVKEDPSETVLVKCEISNEISDNETESVHLKNDGISEQKHDYKLQAHSLHSAADPLANSSNEDVKPKVEKIESSIAQEQDEDEEEYLDNPEYISTNIDFVECKTGQIKTEADIDISCEIKTESVKEEPADGDAILSSDIVVKEEDSDQDVEPGTSRDSEEDSMDEKRVLTYDELIEVVDNQSDIEYLSDEEDGFAETEAYEEDPYELDTENDVNLKEEADNEAKQDEIKKFMNENNLTDKKEIKWKNNVTFSTPNCRWAEKPSRSGTTGDQSGTMELESPLHFFKLYFVDELFKSMEQYTNLYATQEKSQFTFTSVDELHTFVGIHILIGNWNYTRLEYFWDNMHDLRVPMVADNMAIERFYAIRHHLHFVDNQKRDRTSSDRLWKVRPLYNTIRARCLSLTLESELTVDEQCVPFKGTLDVKKGIIRKHKPWGISMFVLYGTSCLIYDFIIYQGATTEIAAVEKKVFGFFGAVVSKLCARVDRTPVKIFFDEIFSSYSILQYLRNKQIYCACTARIDRFGNPPLESVEDMKKRGHGAMTEVISEDGQVIITKWLDKEQKYMASSFLGIGQTDSVKRRDRVNKRIVLIPRPEVVRTFDKCMKRMEKLDFMVSDHRTLIRSTKWTLRMFTHAVDFACTNAWLEYRQKAQDLQVLQRNVVDLSRFRNHVAKALILGNRAPNRNGSAV